MCASACRGAERARAGAGAAARRGASARGARPPPAAAPSARGARPPAAAPSARGAAVRPAAAPSARGARPPRARGVRVRPSRPPRYSEKDYQDGKRARSSSAALIRWPVRAVVPPRIPRGHEAAENEPRTRPGRPEPRAIVLLGIRRGYSRRGGSGRRKRAAEAAAAETGEAAAAEAGTASAARGGSAAEAGGGCGARPKRARRKRARPIRPTVRGARASPIQTNLRPSPLTRVTGRMSIPNGRHSSGDVSRGPNDHRREPPLT